MQIEVLFVILRVQKRQEALSGACTYNSEAVTSKQKLSVTDIRRSVDKTAAPNSKTSQIETQIRSSMAVAHSFSCFHVHILLLIVF